MSRALPLLLWLAAASVAHAQTGDDAEEQAPAGQLTRMPVLTHFVEAPYPPEAEQEGLEGSVLLEIDIDTEGRISRAEVIEPAGHGFDEAAVEAVRQFEFEPAEIDHVPSAVRLTYRYDFVLRPQPAPPPSPEEGSPELPVTLEGRVLERGTRVPQPGAVVVAEIEEQSWEATTDGEGRFAFRLAPGSYRITVFQMAFDRYATGEDILEGEVTEARYYIRRRGGPMEAVVRARREKKEVARRTISLEEIRKMPGTQGDAIRVVQNMPGVARTPMGFGPLVVRGGRPGDTRTYVDGQLVPLLFHFGGLNAVINADFLDSLDFYPGNFPVRYGRSTAGAVDIITRKGRRDRYRGYANVNLLESTFFLEGPLGQNGSFMASVRRSYIDLVLPIILKATGVGGLDFRMAPRFWDYQLKADFEVGANELSFFLFGSDDAMALVLSNPVEFGGEGGGGLEFNIGFHRFTTQWKRRLGAVDHRLAFTAGVDLTNNSIGENISTHLDLRLLALREDLTWKVSDAFTLAGGADVLAARFAYGAQTPPPPAPGEFFNPLVSDRLERVEDSGYAVQPGLFMDAILNPVSWLKLVPGVRYDFDSYLRTGWWNPRISGFASVTEQVVLKAAVGIFSQPPTPEKLVRRFGNPNLIEETSRQYAAGIEWRLADLVSMDLQVYYKDLFNEAVRSSEVVGSPEDLASLMRTNWANDGLGRAYGVELLLRRDPGKRFWGWLALSLGNAQKRDSRDAPWRHHLLNQRYNLIAVLSYKLPWGIDVGTRWRLTEGNTGTRLLGAIYDSDGDQFLPIPDSQRNMVRRPPFFQVDLRVDRRWVFDTWILDAYIDILNVTNHDNVEGASYNYDFSRERPVYGIPIFPAFGVRGEF